MKKNLIKRGDYNRVLITETLPFETPIIFSNDGIYEQIGLYDQACDVRKTIIQALVFGEGAGKSVSATVPYLYKVKKNAQEFRRLALLHPSSQWKIRGFYEKYERLILHYCSISPASIRAPRRVAGSYYRKSSWENINQYKNGSVSVDNLDRYVKHTPSYFSYRGYDRLYKFFNSRDYFSLEKRFSVLMTLDVSKCFDSIYTHCLSWGVKDKAFTKENVSVFTTFAQEFDHVIRHGNHNETNGIPIGPEVSRIFAEILFQEIDRKAIELLSSNYGVDYAFRRYVDDVFIFARNEDVARKIYDIYADVLVGFNLHANSAKSDTIRRPFLTPKSGLIFDAGRQANDFFDKFLHQTDVGKLVPIKVHSHWKLTKSYIDSIKSLCASVESGYDEIASFLISVITERIKRLVNNVPGSAGAGDQSEYLGALEVLLDVLFFLYSVSPSVGASYKLSTSLILSLRFSNRHLPEHSATIAQRIYDLSAELLLEQCGVKHAEGIDGFVHLEYLNVVLAIRELGAEHLLPPEVINDLFIQGKQLSYFTIVSCLFYVRDESRYKDIRKALLKAACMKLNDLSDILMDSEKAYLFLDLLSCPYVDDAQKSAWTKSLYRTLQKAQPNTASLQAFLGSTGQSRALIDWADVDLLNSLEKKELKQAY
ncbi:antiviral reverse transcriptase Drt3b [Uliginosibacterium sp. 31-16]|uniref:antiviral reverse transcriptase Drt3b n=1 Tax=Uliginosibacterium sp. 31-16 TaxID=3068315 RepID=UPI00273E4A0C|nr:antiviral reverse transcriptase Drt3b [Uliginosibacterium sp. 31-16]MDP5239117.1 antiviral reverse transcriptase Drt3b [Uliginosibacterium sp. 31-16]